MQVTKNQIREAKGRSLYDYMLSVHPDMVINEGKSLRLVSNHSLCIKDNFYFDFGGDDKGDNISFLQKYLGLSFVDSVSALIGCHAATDFVVSGSKAKTKFEVPQRAKNDERIISYLSVERGIDKRILRWLINKGVLYQDVTSNCTFINQDRSFYEQRGIFDVPFHRNNDLSPDNIGYWYFNNPDAKCYMKAFICESAIDAISLCLLHPDNGFYFSIAGVGNQQRIDAIKELGLQTILAVDNDESGQKARDRNRDIKHLIPDVGFKDWNEQLRKGKL